jgi:hypothetical protein
MFWKRSWQPTPQGGRKAGDRSKSRADLPSDLWSSGLGHQIDHDRCNHLRQPNPTFASVFALFAPSRRIFFFADER